ncbi:hypothetical protein F5887DRAFT_1070244 [Amanita rubescens]|nr:hypothetical protein F5887DRAFT_1070244 [Amanita rubescens]
MAQPYLDTTVIYDVHRDAQRLTELYSRPESSYADAWGDYRRRVDVAVANREGSHIFQPVAPNDPTLYAPIPVAGQSILFSGTVDYNYSEYQPSVQDTYPTYQGTETQTAPSASPSSASSSSISHSQYTACEVPNTCHYQNDDSTPTQTFPTPSELLMELAGDKLVDPSARYSDRNVNDLPRRARRRPVNRNLGFISGDSETISSHEKKRHYLECLEHYVLYLHQQLKLVGAEPVPLERVQQYRGLSNRSMRTLLVHMESVTKKLDMRTLREEQGFVGLRDAVYKHEAAVVQAFQNLKICQGENTNM